MDKKKLTAALMTVAITGSSFTAFADFKDVQDGDLKEKIQALVDAGIVSGKGNGIFDPAGNMKRGELAKVIALALELPLDKAGAEKKFADVKGHWSAPYVGALVKAGITNGVAPNKFNPEGTVTRQELAVFFIRALGLEDEAEGLALLPQYDDAASIAEWAKFEVALAQALGLTAEEGNFGPNVKASRTEMVEYTYASAFAQEEIAQAVEEIEKIVADLDDIEAAEAAVKAFVEAKLTTDAEVKAAEELLAKANEAIAKVDTADKKAELQKQVDDQKAKLDVAKVEVAAETAVKAYEDAKLTTLEEVTAAEDLGKKAEEAVAKVADAEKKAAFEKRVADQKAKVADAKAKLTKFEVKAVTSTNLKQFTVEFNQTVDKNTVVKSNFVFNGAALGTNDTVTLLEDGKTVLVTLDVAQSQQASKTLVIQNVKDTNGNAVSTFNGTVNFFDTTVPTAVKATVTGPTTVEVEFSEPVTATLISQAAFALDNNTYSLSNAAAVTGKPNVIKVTLGTVIPAGEHTFKINPTGTPANNQIKDHAGFVVPTSDLKFTYAADTVAPTVAIDTVSQTQVVLKFSKPLTSNPGSISVYHTYNNVANYAGVVSTTDNQTFTVTFNGTPLPTGTVTLFVNNASSSSAADAWGNKFVSTSLTANVVADVTAPTVTSVTQFDSNNIDVTFSESVIGANVAANYVLKDSTGATVTINSATQVGTSNTYRLNTATLNGGAYTLEVKGDVITDSSYNKNKLATYTTTLAVTDKVKPTVNGTGVFSSDKTKVQVNFSEAMDASALSTANYLIAFDGTTKQALPAGTTISWGASNKSVIITFPSAQTALVNGTSKVFVAQLADLAGNKTVDFENIVALNSDDITVANIVAGSVKAIAQDTIQFQLNTTLSAIDVSKFTIDTVPAVQASYVNADGKATVTVKAGTATQFATDLSDLAANNIDILAGGLTSGFGTSNSALVTVQNAADYIAPKIVSVATKDVTTVNGKIDTIEVTFSENLYIASVQDDDFTVEGYTVTGVSVAGNIVSVRVQEKSTADTGATPKVTLVGSVADNTAQRNSVGNQAAVTSTDGVKPQLTAVAITTAGATAGWGNDVNDVLTLTFSEAVQLNVADADGALSGTQISAADLNTILGTAVAYDPATRVTATVSGNTITLTLTGNAVTTGAITSGTPVGPAAITNLVRDNAGTPNDLRNVTVNVQ